MTKESTKEVKQPRTIKLSTVIGCVVAFALIATSFVVGFHTSQQMEHTMRQEYANGVASVQVSK